MRDSDLVHAASVRLHDRKSTVAPEHLSEATQERIGAILVGTDLTVVTVVKAVNEWLEMFEKRIGLPNPPKVDQHLGDIIMDVFLTGVFYEQLRSENDGA